MGRDPTKNQGVLDFWCPYSSTFRLLVGGVVRRSGDWGPIADLRLCEGRQSVEGIKLQLIYSAKCVRQIDIWRAQMCSPGQHRLQKTAVQRRFVGARLLLKSATHPALPHSPLSPLLPLLRRYHRKSAHAAQYSPTGERRHVSHPPTPAMSPCSLRMPADCASAITT